MLRTLPACLLLAGCALAQSQSTVVYPGGAGAGGGKNIVLISGDEEYRSEEALTQLGRILSQRHGFHCTVLFAIDPRSGIINPHVRDNIPGLEALDQADLMVIFTRWRILPDEQMAVIDRYISKGKPVVGLRTATHAFAPDPAIHPKVRKYLSAGPAAAPPAISESEWGRFGRYGDGYFGPDAAWRDGFGRFVLGERWVSHHGLHKQQSTQGVIAPGAASHPILRGIADSDIWGSTDVYTVRLPLPGDSKALLLGRTLARRGEYDEADLFYGMRPSDGPPVEGKNDPPMPIAWTKTYGTPTGVRGRAFATTMGASTDLLSAGLRKLLVNAMYWALGMEDKIPNSGAAADVVGEFKPTQYGNHPPEYWVERAVKPADLR